MEYTIDKILKISITNLDLLLHVRAYCGAYAWTQYIVEFYK